MTDRPAVSVILAVLDEADHIDDVMADLLGQDYVGPLEVVVADGGSGDGTLELLEEWQRRDPRLRVVHNPERRQGPGLNLAAAEASGSVLVRADGHTRYAPDYVSASVRALGELGGAVGGRINPEASTRFGRAVAAAMRSPLTMGPGKFHHADARTEADTTYLGAFRKDNFHAVGGYRSFPSGTSEDADLYFRWRRSGRRVFIDPTIRSTYTPRQRPGELWRQYWRYGQGKAEMLWANGQFPSWRPLAPLALVLGVAALVVLGVASGVWWPLGLVLAAWVLLLLGVGVASGVSPPAVAAAAGIMHLAYGLGLLYGLVRGPGPVRHLRE